MMTQAEQLEERAKDAVSRFLVRQLILPTIFFDAHWPNESDRIDVLAIDRSGTGDVHAIEIKRRPQDSAATIQRLIQSPAQFRWLALFADLLDPTALDSVRNVIDTTTSAARIGLIQVISTVGGELEARAVIRAERNPGSLKQQVAQFIAAHTPDIAYGDDEPVENATRYQFLNDREIEDRLVEVDALVREGYSQAAFIVVWGMTEAAMRLIIQREGFGADREPVVSLARLLRSLDLIDEEQARLLRDAAQLRNIAVHGFKNPAQGDYPVAPLITLVQNLLHVIRAQPQTH